MIDIKKLLQIQGIKPRGVIHVGAHEGEELADYLSIGFKRILFIEANPLVFQKLQANTKGHASVYLANVAVSNHSGKVILNVTSMDQSSSILPLKLHQQIYPMIQVTNTVEVPARTLDELLPELGLDPADFNFLHLDIQGAEYLALQGAENTLRGIEAINTEVNFAELYAGCGLITQLEEHLGARGFNRIALARPYHPTWGDAFYVRRPLVTMSTLGRNGRFANQLFQYLYLRLVAQRQGAVVQTPPWPGRAIYGLDDQDLLRPLPLKREDELPQPERLFDGSEPLPGDTDFYGWYQVHSRSLAPHREFIRQLFRPVQKFRAALDGVVKNIRAQGSPLVALHLRRGDYGTYDTAQFFRAPAVWYREWLESMRAEFDHPVIYLCSESPAEVQAHFAGWKTSSFAQLRGIPPDLAFLVDFYVLTQADAVAISNSSYSFFASLLNTQSRHFVRPTLEDRKLVPFDPWDAPVLMPRRLVAGEQQQLDASDRIIPPPL
jgi:FkbM family methyltransferase